MCPPAYAGLGMTQDIGIYILHLHLHLHIHPHHTKHPNLTEAR